MACEFSTKDNGDGASIRIELGQGFDTEDFANILKTIPGIEIKGAQNVLTSFGPAETIDEIETSLGTISISKEIEGFDPCIFIYSDAKELMTDVVSKMKSSPAFQFVGEV